VRPKRRKMRRRTGPPQETPPHPNAASTARLRRLPAALDGLLLRIPWIARRRAAQLSRREVLAARPVRNAVIEWEVRRPEGAREEEPEVVVLLIPRRRDRWGRLFNRLFEAPSHRQVVLDELGTEVWQMCDGETSIEAMVVALARKHKLERREVELSLTVYLRTLARRGFIGLRMDGGEEDGADGGGASDGRA